ncbi:MAG: hypothetical protein Q7J54_04140 [Candidatus Woesearchaeota archaeon]|nr:hypothetical protein [Candidatus Woesearchaeota archaeon]
MAEKETELKIKKKKWHSIIAPKIFSEQVIGETLVTDIKSLLNRSISANLMNLTGDPKNQNINMQFVINRIEGNRVFTDVIGYMMNPASIRRMIRREKERVDDSFACKTLDNKVIRIKPLAITVASTKNSILSKLRKKMQVLLKEAVAKLTYEALLYEIIGSRLQKKVKADMSKIYPVKNLEIKMMTIEEGKKPEEIKEAELKEEKPQAELKENEEEAKAQPENAEETAEIENKTEETAEA